ncbi:AAA family ATPase [Sporosarcina sp. ITBMC105]
MTEPIKIALVGKLRAGKDALAMRLALRHDFATIAFGDALKRVAHDAFPWIPREPKPRDLYQFMDVLREYDEDIYVKHLERAYRVYADMRHVEGIVVTDIRQRNEYDWCRANGFVIVRVNAADELRIKRAIAAGDDFTVHDLAHKTELAVDNFAVDYEIDNNGTLVDLYAQVDALKGEITAKGGR